MNREEQASKKAALGLALGANRKQQIKFLLLSKERPFTAAEIAKALKFDSSGPIYKNLRTLVKRGEVRWQYRANADGKGRKPKEFYIPDLETQQAENSI